MRPLLYFFSFLLFFSCTPAYSQLSVRLAPIDSSLPVEQVESINFTVGLMYELSPNLNLTLELKKDYTSTFGDPVYRSYNLMKNNVLVRAFTTHYYFSEISYRSAYSFRGNDENSGYVASGIGLRFNGWQTNYTDRQPVNKPTVVSDKYTQLTYPLSLYLGHKRANDGFFTDFYIGFNYNMGTSDGWKNSVAKEIEFPNTLVKIGFQYGMAFHLNVIKKRELISK
jgi:hypothetical protein